MLCLVFGLLAFLLGPRARTVLLGVVVAGSIAVVAVTFTVRKPVEAGASVRSAPGRIVTPIGAAVGLIAAAAGLPLSTKVRRVRMPESGPEAGE